MGGGGRGCDCLAYVVRMSVSFSSRSWIYQRGDSLKGDEGVQLVQGLAMTHLSPGVAMIVELCVRPMQIQVASPTLSSHIIHHLSVNNKFW